MIIRWQVSDRVKTDFPASRHGMLLSTACPFIHQREIKVTKITQGRMCATRAVLKNLEANLPQETKHLHNTWSYVLLVTIWIQIKWKAATRAFFFPQERVKRHGLGVFLFPAQDWSLTIWVIIAHTWGPKSNPRTSGRLHPWHVSTSVTHSFNVMGRNGI
jgi:hypothetical protein